jgi:hypothetical protein
VAGFKHKDPEAAIDVSACPYARVLLGLMSSARLAASTFGLKPDVPPPEVIPELDRVVVGEVPVPGPFGCGPKQYIRRPRETWILLPIFEQIGFWKGFGTKFFVCACAGAEARTRISAAIKLNRSNSGTALVFRSCQKLVSLGDIT